MTLQRKAKPQKCSARGCRNPARFLAPQSGLRKRIGWCSDECGAVVALEAKRRADKDSAKKARAEQIARRKALDRPKDLIPRVQAAFNAWIRERDWGMPCISCGRNDDEIRNDPCGGTWDCGHFLSRGSHPELRFHEANAHRQCKRCNSWKSGNATRYEENLVARIGPANVAWLKGPHPPRRYTVPELRALTSHYNALVREARRARGAK